MSAVPAYTSPLFEPEAPRSPKRSLRLRHNPHPGAQGASLATVARIVAVVLVVLTALCIARLALTSATVAAAIENQEVSNQIDVARTEGTSLEISQSKLSTPTRIKEAAAEMGMSAPSRIMMIDLSDDVVVTDSAGNLSLSGSMAAVTQSQ